MKNNQLTFEEAKRQYIHRFTMEHVPQWAREPAPNGLYYKPQHASDQEWYDSIWYDEFSYSQINTSPTWPLGKGFSETPYENCNTIVPRIL
jgi:hypothetical protein